MSYQLVWQVLNLIGNMNLYEFLMQSPKQIQEVFRSKSWFDNYKMLPKDIPSFCKCFNLELDDRIKYYGNFRGMTFYIDIYINEFFGNQLVQFNYSVTGRNHSIVVHFDGFSDSYSTSRGFELGNNFLAPGKFEKKDELYYRLGYDVPNALIADSYKKDSSYYFYKYSDKNPVQFYVDKLVKFANDISPYFKSVYESFHDGTFSKLFKKYVKREVRNGDMTNAGFGVGLRGLVNLMYYVKTNFDIDLSLEDCMPFVREIHKEFGSFSGERYPKELIPIANIFFWNRDGYFENYSKFTKEEFLRLINKYK